MCNDKPGLKLSTELYTEPKKADAKKWGASVGFLTRYDGEFR